MKNQVMHEEFRKDLAEFLMKDIQNNCEFISTKVSRKGKTFMVLAVPESVMEHKICYFEYDGVNLSIKSSYFDSFEVGYKYIEELKQKYDIRPR